MHIRRLQIQGLRCLDNVRIELEPGLNVFLGPNGAGKSSVLEAIYLLSHGRSFRSGAREALLSRDHERLSVYAEVDQGDQGTRRLGLGRQASRWQVHVDGEPHRTLGDLVAHCAVICFEPGAHALIAGPADERRRFLDWGVFHVEQAFLADWRHYQRALRQRNALLRQVGPDAAESQLAPWEVELARAGHAIDLARQRYVERLRPHLDNCMQSLLPELGPMRLEYRRGWAEDRSLASTLVERRARDIARGHTATGPHRADWSVTYARAPQREHLSRGQEKLCALACLLAQGYLYAELHGHWPVVCLDDLASELDAAHQAGVVAMLDALKAQVLVTGTAPVPSIEDGRATVFHVEHGRITAAPSLP